MSRKEKMKIYHGIPTYISYDNSVYIDFSNGYYGKGVHSVIDGRSSIGGDTSSLTLLDGITGRSAKFIKSNKSLPYLHFIRLNETFDLKEGLSISAIIKTKDISSYFNGIYAMYVNDFSQSLMSPNMVAIHRFLGIDKSTNGMDRISISAYKNNVTVNSTGFFDVPTNKYSLFQFIVKGMISYYYIDGELVLTQDLNSFNMDVTKFNCLQFLIPYNVNGEFYIERFIISKDTSIIPNCIPNDHKNGKAIIKPRMNQQQIKGDPLYSQVTELLVDSSAKIPKPYSNTANSDGTYTHLYKPELSVLNANLWNNTSKLKIKGLNGEIISGVIDSDTALCKITKDIPQTSGNSNVSVSVDDTSRLSVGDTLTLVYLANGNSYSNFLTVVSVDSSTEFTGKVWSGGGSVSINNRAYLFESTASSSSPIVKTEDGTTVVGTWSGLGTREATFTLGDNTGLKGKDLYVTYSLNIPSGNSDFSELPYSVARAYNEVGLEMKPVTEIVIEDDFRGKIGGSNIECPHNMGYAYNSSITNPTSIPTSSNTSYYDKISKSDGTTDSTTTKNSTAIPQQLFSFNLIEMVERKLGCEIPSRDKVQWLKDNIINYTCTAYGKGTHPTGNKYVLNNYCFAENRWYGDPRTHSLSTIASIQYIQSQQSWVTKSIDDSGFIHFIVYTDASDGVTASALYTDYVKLEIKLKTDSTFTTLYCDNKRAREDSCNPVLVQKETKTVKRYVPSKECFVTEYLPYGVNPKITTDVSTTSHVASSDKMFVTTEGTGLYDSNLVRSGSKNVIARLGVPTIYPYLYTPSALVSKQSWNNNISAILPYKYIVATNSITVSFNLFNMPQEDLPNGRVITLTKYLDNVNGELYLKVLIQEHLNGVYQSYKIASYRIPNRPLIK